jgi:hypothetical protein
MRLRPLSFPKQAPAPQRDGRPALGRRCHAKALRWRFFPLSYDLIRALSLGGSRPKRLANLTHETLDSRAYVREGVPSWNNEVCEVLPRGRAFPTSDLQDRQAATQDRHRGRHAAPRVGGAIGRAILLKRGPLRLGCGFNWIVLWLSAPRTSPPAA